MRTIRRAATVIAGLALILGTGCQEGSTSTGDGLGVQVRFLTDEGVSSEIPASMYDTFLSVCIVPEGEDCGDRVTYIWVGNPTDMDGLFAPGEDIDRDGRPEKSFEGLPMDTTLKVIVTAVPAVDPTADSPIPNPGGGVLYASRFDGVRLSKGQRRFLTVTMYPANQFGKVDATVSQAPEDFTGRFGATATATEPDGRVLIAGGFDFVTTMTLATCQAAVPAVPAGSVCFQRVASDTAFIFEPGSGRIYELPRLGAARAFHSAVALPDGRVVLSGGVDAAILYFAPLADGGFQPNFAPYAGGAGMTGLLTTFEIFDPALNALPDDPNRNGNPERGGFQPPGNLAVPRAFASAALWPDPDEAAPPRVVVFGGLDPAVVTSHPSTTWEVWNGTGDGTFALSAHSLSKARAFLGTGLMRFSDPQLWLVGGVSAPAGDFDLFTAWTTDENTTAPLPTGALYAAKNFWMPAVTPLGNVHAPSAQLVTGSIGPMCAYDSGTGSYTPTYDLTTGDVRLCPPAAVPPYVINHLTSLRLDGISGWAPTDNPHVLGAAATAADGSAIVVGGAVDFGFAATKGSHRITWNAGTGAAAKDAALPANAYPSSVLLPAATATLGGDVLFVGGMAVNLTAATPALTFLDDVVLFNQE